MSDGAESGPKPRRAGDQLGLEVESRDILAESERRQELVSATGRQTVPCLRIAGEDGEDDRWMHESRDIIDYLRELSAASCRDPFVIRRAAVRASRQVVRGPDLRLTLLATSC